MARPCTICSHAERDAIEAAIVGGASFRNVAARYEMSPPSVLRHRNSHMAKQLAEAVERRLKDDRQEAEDRTPQAAPAPGPPQPSAEPSLRQAVAEGLDIAQQLRAINGAALAVLQDARRAGDGRLVLLAADRVQRQLELQAKLLGQLDERPVLNVLISPEWLAVRGAILDVLRDDAPRRLELVRRLRALEPS